MQEDGEFEDSVDYILSNTHDHTYTLKSWACPHQDRETDAGGPNPEDF